MTVPYRQYTKFLKGALAAALVGTLLILAACGGDEPTPAPTATPVPPPTATPAPATDGYARTATGYSNSQACGSTTSGVTVEPARIAAGRARVATRTAACLWLRWPSAPRSGDDRPPGEREQSPAPEADKASLSGLLYSYSLGQVIPGTQFYLTKAITVSDQLIPPTWYTGPKEELGDVNGFSDAYGRFAFDDVPPGTYYLAVWTVYDWLLAFESREAKMPLLIQLKAGDQLDLGRLFVEWP